GQKAADQEHVAGTQQGRPNADAAGNGERALLATQQATGTRARPPRALVNAPSNGTTLAVRAFESPTPDRAQDITLEHHRAVPVLGDITPAASAQSHRMGLHSGRFRAGPVKPRSGR